HPRWSKRTIRHFLGSKYRRWVGFVPPPGPPCRNTTGLPLALPHSSKWIVWSGETRRRPVRYGLRAGKSRLTVRDLHHLDTSARTGVGFGHLMSTRCVEEEPHGRLAS